MATFTITFTDEDAGLVAMHSTSEPKVGDLEKSTPAQMLGIAACQCVQALMDQLGVDVEKVDGSGRPIISGPSF